MRPEAALTSSSSVVAPLSQTRLGLVGQVATSWGVSGGVVAAMVVTAHVFAGQLSSSLGFLTTTLFFLAGTIIGYLHGGILAYLSRPADVDRKLALKRLGLAALYAVPAMMMGWVIAMVLAMSAASVLAGRKVAMAVSLLGWLAAAGVLGWAVVETRQAVKNLFQRWPASRSLFIAMGLAFLALLPVFVVTRPEMWVLGVKPSATAAGVMALVAAVWILGPLGTLVLLARRAWTRQHPPASSEVPHGME